MRYLVSIHDVWPGNLPVVEDHWNRLRSLGARRIALMVVPQYHGLRTLQEGQEFPAWLREKASAGSEILLHGFRHLMPERVDPGFRGQRSLWGRWVNRSLVGGEAEFCGLAGKDGESLLRLGSEALSRAGFPARGFVAPTWHGAPPASSLRGLGFTLWETRFFLRHLPSGQARFVPPLSWSPGPEEPRLAGGKPWLETLLRLPLLKAAIHPGDLAGGAALRTLERVFSRGREIAYEDVFPGPVPASPVPAAP